MKKIFNILLLSALTLGTTTSCSDFLQNDPPSSPSESVFWQKKSDFQSALAACYSKVYNWPGVMSQIIACFDNLTDNSICQYDEGTYGSTRTMATGDITPSTGGFVSYMYRDCYAGIARANLLIEKLAAYTGTDMTDTEKTLIMAEAKAMRGYYYQWLYMCYDQVPLVTASLNTSNMYMEKASRSDIFKQIISDYDAAIAVLPNVAYNGTSSSGHLTAGALKGLEARLYLYSAYDATGKASNTEYLKKVVSLCQSIKNFSLASTMRYNFVTANQAVSPEIMFSVRYLQPNITNSMDLYYGAWATCQVTRSLVDEFECTDGQKWGVSPLTVAVDNTLINSSDETKGVKQERLKLFQNRDPRMAQTLCGSNYITFPEGVIRDGQGGSLTHFNALKLIQPTTSEIGYSTVSDEDVVILRYAEILLDIAEAENELNGPTQTVYDAVNAIRLRSMMPALPTGLTKDQMREKIRHEWRVEFAFEGQRYFQLKRWRLMETVFNGAVDPAVPGYKKVFKTAFYNWPIPLSEIDKANGALTQDPNYK